MFSLKVRTNAEAYKIELKEIGGSWVRVLSIATRVGKTMTRSKLMIPSRLVERLTNQLPGVVVYCGLVQLEGTTNPRHTVVLCNQSVYTNKTYRQVVGYRLLCHSLYKSLRKSKLGRDYYDLNITAMPRFTLPQQTITKSWQPLCLMEI